MTVKELMEHWDTCPSILDIYYATDPSYYRNEYIERYDFFAIRGVLNLTHKYQGFIEKYGDKKIIDFRVMDDGLKLYFYKEEKE